MSRAHEAADAIIADISDRRGLKWEWNRIDEDIRTTIREEWTRIIGRAFGDAEAEIDRLTDCYNTGTGNRPPDPPRAPRGERDVELCGSPHPFQDGLRCTRPRDHNDGRGVEDVHSSGCRGWMVHEDDPRPRDVEPEGKA